MMRSRPLAVALVAGLALVGAGCGASAKASAAKVADTSASTASGASSASSATTAAGVITATDQAGQEPMGDGDGDHGGRGPGGFGDLAAAATAIGVSEDELRTAVDGGQTIAQVAAAKGVSTDAVVAAMVAALKAHFEPEIASGEHTQAEVDQILAGATAQMTAVVNGQQPAFGPGGRGPGDDDGDGPHGDDDGGGAPSGSTGRKANSGASATTTA